MSVVEKFLKENPDYVKQYYKSKKTSKKSLPTSIDYLEEYSIEDLKDEIRYLRDKLDERQIPYNKTTLTGTKSDLKRKVKYLESIAEQNGGENVAKSLIKTFVKGHKDSIKTNVKGYRETKSSGSYGTGHTQVHIAPRLQKKYDAVQQACKRAGYDNFSSNRIGWIADCPDLKAFKAKYLK